MRTFGIRWHTACVLLLVLIAGCERRTVPVPSVPPVYDRVRAMLDGMAETGDRSPLRYLRGSIETLERDGDPKAADLLADLHRLENSSDATQFKALAAAMRDKVPAAASSPK